MGFKVALSSMLLVLQIIALIVTGFSVPETQARSSVNGGAIMDEHHVDEAPMAPAVIGDHVAGLAAHGAEPVKSQYYEHHVQGRQQQPAAAAGQPIAGSFRRQNYRRRQQQQQLNNGQQNQQEQQQQGHQQGGNRRQRVPSLMSTLLNSMFGQPLGGAVDQLAQGFVRQFGKGGGGGEWGGGEWWWS